MGLELAAEGDELLVRWLDEEITNAEKRPRPESVEAAVGEMVAMGKASKPSLAGRLEAAGELVLAGRVVLLMPHPGERGGEGRAVYGDGRLLPVPGFCLSRGLVQAPAGGADGATPGGERVRPPQAQRGGDHDAADQREESGAYRQRGGDRRGSATGAGVSGEHARGAGSGAADDGERGEDAAGGPGAAGRNYELRITN